MHSRVEIVLVRDDQAVVRSARYLDGIALVGGKVDLWQNIDIDG